ncbi:hypothetical protein SEA_BRUTONGASTER_138 [Gordonia phage BrutonGaster]|uniref:Uncharacterized protein n=1 Tax=Gordonia phage BrutonGaster TaxID=2530116 RepID=A0A482JKS8_9CAUD|nr:hypothetical protein HOV26_gp044 [Gordonia phage BrutonGaster]QBP33352.1 hypothetical protein SEA_BRUTONGASTER_138 [Gordonia phage BrutonGaster]
MNDAETIFNSDLFGAIVQQQIADAQATQDALDRHHNNTRAQLDWLRQELEHYAFAQDSKLAEYKLLSILTRSYKVTADHMKEVY